MKKIPDRTKIISAGKFPSYWYPTVGLRYYESDEIRIKFRNLNYCDFLILESLQFLLELIRYKLQIY